MLSERVWKAASERGFGLWCAGEDVKPEAVDIVVVVGTFRLRSAALETNSLKPVLEQPTATVSCASKEGRERKGNR